MTAAVLYRSADARYARPALLVALGLALVGTALTVAGAVVWNGCVRAESGAHVRYNENADTERCFDSVLGVRDPLRYTMSWLDVATDELAVNVETGQIERWDRHHVESHYGGLAPGWRWVALMDERELLDLLDRARRGDLADRPGYWPVGKGGCRTSLPGSWTATSGHPATAPHKDAEEPALASLRPRDQEGGPVDRP